MSFIYYLLSLITRGSAFELLRSLQQHPPALPPAAGSDAVVKKPSAFKRPAADDKGSVEQEEGAQDEDEDLEQKAAEHARAYTARVTAAREKREEGAR